MENISEMILPAIIIGLLLAVLTIAFWFLARMWLIDYAAKKLDKILSKYFKPKETEHKSEL